MSHRVVNISDGRSLTRLATVVEYACAESGVDVDTARRIAECAMDYATAEGWLVVKP
jgi:hypothetical protein